jgi:hypothetical protein
VMTCTQRTARESHSQTIANSFIAPSALTFRQL